jgi:hypothetical protein
MEVSTEHGWGFLGLDAGDLTNVSPSGMDPWYATEEPLGVHE